jgi:hypothetical protein
MKRAITALCLAAAASGVMAVGAETTRATVPQQKSSKTEKTVTLTGCLEEGLAANTFVLKNVGNLPANWGTSGSAETGSTSGSSAMGEETRGTSGSTIIVELLPMRGVELKAHVGNKVEIIGVPSEMMEHPKDSKDSTGTSGSGMGQTGSSGMAMTMEHRVKVQSVKHLSDTCSDE